MDSVFYLMMIIGIFIFIFAISGNIWFGLNDAVHFGTFYLSISTITRIFTEEDWTEIMYNNAYGCANYGYIATCPEIGEYNCAARLDDPNDLTAVTDLACCCEAKSTPQPLSAYCYFTFLVIVGAWVLMKLFIGVITTSMDTAYKAQMRLVKERKMMKKIVDILGFSTYTINLFHRTFEYLVDYSGNGMLNETHMFKALLEIGVHVDKAAINELYLNMASENVDTISFYEYVIFMCTLKANDLVKHPELLSTVGEKHAENHVKHNCCAMISGRRKKKTKVTPKVHDKQTYKFVREGLINENMVQRSSTKSSVTSKDPIDKLQELRRTHGAGSQEYKDFLQQTLNQKKQRQQEKDIVAEKE